MDTTNYIALSRQSVLQRQMANIANNIANSTTTGYQAEHMVFETVLQDGGEPGELAFVQDVALVRNTEGGPFVQTGNTFDLAIEGDGYFPVRTPNGIAYTRSGQFQIDLNGEIVSPDGYQLLDETFQTVTIPNDGGAVSVANDGTISNEAGILARLRPMAFNNEQELARIGNSLLQTDQVPTANPDATIKQGFLEGSNVQSVLEMTRLMDTVRAFQGTQRLIETQHELTRRTVERVLSNG